MSASTGLSNLVKILHLPELFRQSRVTQTHTHSTQQDIGSVNNCGPESVPLQSASVCDLIKQLQ